MTALRPLQTVLGAPGPVIAAIGIRTPPEVMPDYAPGYHRSDRDPDDGSAIELSKASECREEAQIERDSSDAADKHRSPQPASEWAEKPNEPACGSPSSDINRDKLQDVHSLATNHNLVRSFGETNQQDEGYAQSDRKDGALESPGDVIKQGLSNESCW
jgi:hypothetical protein